MNEYITNAIITINHTDTHEEGTMTQRSLYQVNLRNNRSYEATSTDELVFMVKLDSGVRAYSVTQLRSFWKIEDEEEVVVIQDTTNNSVVNKEDNMDNSKAIFHYLREMTSHGKREVVRIVTTILKPEEKAAYEVSLKSNKPVAMMGDTGLLLAMKTGGWEFITLKFRLADQGKDFRLMIADHDTLRALDNTAAFVEGSTFAWANASCGFFLRIPGTDKWGLDELGLTAFNTKKVSKRNQEVTRLTAHYFVSENASDIHLREFKSDLDAALFDGMNFVARSFASKMGFNKKVNRINIRILTADGVIKGDAIIVPDGFIAGADMVYFGENLKSDLKTNGWIEATGFEHHTEHFAVWDDQSMINNKAILSEKHQMRDINTLVQNLRDSLAAGELPKWLTLGEDMHDDSGVPMMEQLSDRMHLVHMRWQAEMGDVRPAQNLVYMGINGILTRMRASLQREKMWLPMSNAFTGTVVTYEALTMMGNIRIASDLADKVFYDRKYGVVVPGHRFIDTYALHGGWDQDDTTKVVLIKLWSSSESAVTMHKMGFTVPQEMEVPTSAEDAVLCVAFIRSPNGPGEFSIEEMDFASMEQVFHNLDMDNITVVDLAGRMVAKPQSVLLENIVIKGLPVANYDGAEFSMDNAKSMMRAQAINPGIGGMANMMMHWVNSFGPSFPAEMVGLFEDMVDATQQEADINKFMAITEERNNVFAQWLEKVKAEDVKIDSYLVNHRMKNIKMRSDLPKSKLVNGRLHRVYMEYNSHINIIQKEILLKSLQMRQESDLAKKVREHMVGRDTREWAFKFHAKYTNKLNSVGHKLETSLEFKKLQGYNEHDGRNQARTFADMVLQEAKGKETAAIVREMVAEIQALGDEADRFVVGLYKYMITSTDNGRNVYDRIIFQAGATGELTVMDLFIQGLKNRSLV